MLERFMLQPSHGDRAVINRAYRMDEMTAVDILIKEASVTDEQLQVIKKNALMLVEQVRARRMNTRGIDSLLTEYSLSSEEGIALMCLSEALLRIPDNTTINSLIKDKLTNVDWKSHQGQSTSFFVNATTWALMLTGKVLLPESAESIVSKALFKLLNFSSETMIRKAVDRAMRIMSKQFVFGETIHKAISNATIKEARGYRYSYDMLGEAALTSLDAERYFIAYREAIEAIGLCKHKDSDIYKSSGISIKLSALHPRYQEAQRTRVLKELSPKLLQLAEIAKKFDIPLTVDAEESERLDLSLDLIERVFCESSLDGWNGLGLAVQSYQKRGFYLIDWIASLARSKGRRIMVRLIKGAYWDSEIKKTQMLGLDEYPVFTRKVFTDVSFQACAKKLLTLTADIYPQFATHNAYSVACILSLAGDYRDFEFQCLHGMGSELYEQIVPEDKFNIPCRIYAPVGSYENLLPYLVRRLLENGANSSFVNRIVDEKAPITSLVEDPVGKALILSNKADRAIVLPSEIFLPDRVNSSGFDFSNRDEVARLQRMYCDKYLSHWLCMPILADKVSGGVSRSVTSPQNNESVIGHVSDSSVEDIAWALSKAESAFAKWSVLNVCTRAEYLEHVANLLECHKVELLAMLCLEAGKTWNDCVSELREAIDYCRYYAKIAIDLMGRPRILSGYTGESNVLSLHARGVILCISPWNFPLAIFTGQVVAALVTGNCVVAKPAPQTSLIAAFVVQLMHKAGIPQDVLQLLPGDAAIGASVVLARQIKAVVFTGSTQTANAINQVLATRGGPIIPFIAETGGINAMIVDSSALLEQVVTDVLISAFGSAGQRCSALRVLYIQEEVYLRTIDLMKGSMAELCIGLPQFLSTDVGPVIDESALNMLKEYVSSMQTKHKIIYQCNLPADIKTGYFMPPTVIAIDKLSSIEKEIFGPVLHVVRYKSSDLQDVINQINNSGYGLTLGIHSRINATIDFIRQNVCVGNCYVNRSMIGAVVGLQPFGGEGLSGTGPKAGGPNYLLRLCQERTYTVDTTAAGGNATLMSLTQE